MATATTAHIPAVPAPRAAARTLRIGIDAHGVGGHSQGLGNETYFKNLIAGLLQIDPENEYHIFVNHADAMRPVVDGKPNAKLVSLVPHNQWLQRPFSLPLYSNYAKLDVVHTPFIRPPFARAKTVITVHDIFYEVYPQYFRLRDRLRMKWLVRRHCGKADMVFTVSEYARRQIHKIYGTPLDKIVVTYNAADQYNALRPDPEAVAGLNLPQPFVFYIGLIQPKKNLTRLVQAFDLMKYRTGLPHHLVLGGKWGWGNEDLTRTLARLQYRDHIHFVGYLGEQQIRAAMLQSDLFVFPSIWESFGIPPLEAQQLGIPTVVSNSTCFPEIYGDSTVYCDPLSIDSIAQAMERALTDQQLRASVSARGAEWCRKYTWARTARAALDAYQRLAGERQQL